MLEDLDRFELKQKSDKTSRACGNCKHLVKEEESWELPQYWYWRCNWNPNMENLKSFPFKNTKCRGFDNGTS